MVLAILALCVACAAPTPAQLRAERLDGMFASLRQAPDEASARRIEEQIRDHWWHSGDPAIDASLAQAVVEARDYAYDRALAVLDDLVATHPGYAEGWNQRATVLFFMGRHDESLKDIERTLALEPRHFGALAGRGIIYLRRGDVDRGEASIREAMAIDPFLRERVLLREPPPR